MRPKPDEGGTSTTPASEIQIGHSEGPPFSWNVRPQQPRPAALHQPQRFREIVSQDLPPASTQFYMPSTSQQSPMMMVGQVQQSAAGFMQHPNHDHVSQQQHQQQHQQQYQQQHQQQHVINAGIPHYLRINEYYPGLQRIYDHPPFYLVRQFLTPFECDLLIKYSENCMSTSPVVGKGNGEVSPSRTSSSCYHAREDVPFLMDKVCRLTGKPPGHVELPQVGRYTATQQYLPHFDAFDVGTEEGRRFAQNGGNRVATVLIYLNDVEQGGCTSFPRLSDLRIRPQKGTAAVFFPSTVSGLLDPMALHAAEPAIDTKFVSQVWIRQWDYVGVPSRQMKGKA